MPQHAARKRSKAACCWTAARRLLKGGDSGPVIVPGDPEASLLIKAVRYTDPDLQMPKDKKLPDDANRGSGGVGENGRARPAHRHRRPAEMDRQQNEPLGLAAGQARGHSGGEQSRIGARRRWTISSSPSWMKTG